MEDQDLFLVSERRGQNLNLSHGDRSFIFKTTIGIVFRCGKLHRQTTKTQFYPFSVAISSSSNDVWRTVHVTWTGLVDSRVQRWTRRYVFLQPRVFLHHHLCDLTIQTPKTIVILIALPLLFAAPPPPGPSELLQRAPFLPLVPDLGAVQDVDGVGRQGELQTVEVLVHHLFAVDELAAVDLEEQDDKKKNDG